jgi:hypothetical protein
MNKIAKAIYKLQKPWTLETAHEVCSVGKLNDQYTSTMPKQFPVWAFYGQKTGFWYTKQHL